MTLKNNKPAAFNAVTYLCIFLLLTVCNLLTPYVVDDFRYMFSFYDGEPVETLWDIVMSMRVHRYHMNGRVAAHTLVQLFAMTPGWVFDLTNAAMYVLQIALLHKIGRGERSAESGMPLLLFCGAWLFCPAFGQVNLWQDGACNYLWSGVFALLYLLPFVEDYLFDRQVKTLPGRLVFLGLAFFMGAYSETVSAAAIFMSMLLVLLMKVMQKKKWNLFWLASVVTAFLGYLFIYTAPAQWREKGAEMKLSVLIANFFHVALQYWLLLGALLVLFVILLAVNLRRRTDSRRILLALVFFAGSLAANFIMMFASYYTTRSGIGAFVFLLGADGILLYPLMADCSHKRLKALVLAAALLVTLPYLAAGLKDIHSTCLGIRENEACIYRCREEGTLDIRLPVVETATKYSAIDGLKYLDTEIADEWPNDSMSKYYGVSSILGVKPE